jgi:hypothetical protein
MCCRSFCAGLALPGLVSDGVRYSRHLFGGGGDRAAPQSGDYDPLLDETTQVDRRPPRAEQKKSRRRRSEASASGGSSRKSRNEKQPSRRKSEAAAVPKPQPEPNLPMPEEETERERRAREIREIGTVDERVMDIEVAEGTIKE